MMRLRCFKTMALAGKDLRKVSGRSLFFCLGTLAVSFIPGILCAFNETDLAKLLSTKQCRWCNLHNADLSGAQLVVAELANATLVKAGLADANLSRANLSGAFLTNANLTGANLSDAYLVKANLSGADLSDANLSGADLSGAIWTNGARCEQDSIGECKRLDVFGVPK